MFGNIKKFLRNFNLKENNRPLIFLVCLLISGTLWFVKALEKRYETTVSIPVKYISLPENKPLINRPPTRLIVKIKAQGFIILRHKLGLSISSINFDIRKIDTNTFVKKNPSDFFVLSDQGIPQISNQIDSDITILDISPDTLYFHFEKIPEKKMEMDIKRYD